MVDVKKFAADTKNKRKKMSFPVYLFFFIVPNVYRASRSKKENKQEAREEKLKYEEEREKSGVKVSGLFFFS